MASINAISDQLYNTIQDDDMYLICRDLQKLITHETETENSNQLHYELENKILELISHKHFKNHFNSFNGLITNPINIISATWYDTKLKYKNSILEFQVKDKITRAVRTAVTKMIIGGPEIGSGQIEITENILGMLFDPEHEDKIDLKFEDIFIPDAIEPEMEDIVNKVHNIKPTNISLNIPPTSEDQIGGGLINTTDDLAGIDVTVPQYVQTIVDISDTNNIFSLHFYSKFRTKSDPNTYTSILTLEDAEKNILLRIFFENDIDKLVYSYKGFDYMVDIIKLEDKHAFFLEPSKFNKYIKLPDNSKQYLIDKYELFNSITIDQNENKITIFGKNTDYKDLDGNKIYTSFMTTYLPKLIGVDNQGNNVSFITPYIKHIFVVRNNVENYKSDSSIPVIEFGFPKLTDENIDFIFGNN